MYIRGQVTGGCLGRWDDRDGFGPAVSDIALRRARKKLPASGRAEKFRLTGREYPGLATQSLQEDVSSSKTGQLWSSPGSSFMNFSSLFFSPSLPPIPPPPLLPRLHSPGSARPHLWRDHKGWTSVPKHPCGEGLSRIFLLFGAELACG